MLKALSREQSKIKELEAELSKFRASEPGSEKETTSAKSDADKPKGAAALASEFDSLGE